MMIQNHEQYTEARRMIDEHWRAVRQWLDEHNTNAMPADVAASMPHADRVTNDLRSAVEVYEFQHDPPDDYFLYVKLNDPRQWIEPLGTVTTWTGDTLGHIIERGYPFRSNFGDERVYIRFRGINGHLYWGWFFKSAGDYARVWRIKGNPLHLSPDSDGTGTVTRGNLLGKPRRALYALCDGEGEFKDDPTR